MVIFFPRQILSKVTFTIDLGHSIVVKFFLEDKIESSNLPGWNANSWFCQ